MKEDKGHYRNKHAEDAIPDPAIAAEIEKRTKEGILSCIDASAISLDTEREMLKVGQALDLLEITIAACQLGLFGYQPNRRIVTAAPSVSPEMESAIRGKLVGGALPCKAAWDIAAASSVPKMDVASACEALGIKIVSCQLGAF